MNMFKAPVYPVIVEAKRVYNEEVYVDALGIFGRPKKVKELVPRSKTIKKPSFINGKVDVHEFINLDTIVSIKFEYLPVASIVGSYFDFYNDDEITEITYDDKKYENVYRLCIDTPADQYHIMFLEFVNVKEFFDLCGIFIEKEEPKKE